MGTSEHDPVGILGTLIHDKYRVEAFVAEGGFSVLYRAQHLVWQQPVALKFLKVLADAPPEQRDQLLKGFVQEGALLRELSSRTASILQAHDVGTYTASTGEWFPYLVLEWLDGAPLDAVLLHERETGVPPWSLEACVHLLEPGVKALEVVHRKGVAHRDIKPGNLFVLGDPRSADAFIKVLDFGIAKVVSDAAQLTAAQAKTGTGFTSFTPWYGAPEQFSRSIGATGPWTDVFAIALVMLEMMTHRPPLEGEELAQLAFATTNPTERPTPQSRGVEVTDAVEAVFQKAVAIKPTDRYATAGDFWNDLRQAMGMGGMPKSRLPSANTMAAGVANAATAVTTAPVVAASGAGFSTNPTILAPNTPPSSPAPATPPSAGSSSKLGLIAAGVIGVVVLGVIGLKVANSGGQSTTAGLSHSTAPVQSSPAKASASVAAAKPQCPEGMVPIPGGPFFMGYDGEGALDFEKPPHKVILSAYCMDITEVTVDDYRKCSDKGECERAATTVNWPGMTPSEKKTYGPLCNIDDAGRDRHPINCVDWSQATSYCKYAGKRLPTSAEWEFAVRSPDGRIYPWGDDPPDANHLNACGKECVEWGKKNGLSLPAMHKEDDGYQTTAPVGSFPKGRSKYGLDDVIGNVMEWVQDWDGAYTKEDPPPMNPTGPTSGKDRVIRGGAWNAGSNVWVRPSFRFQFPPDAKSHAIGFRCAKSQEP